MSRRPPAPDSRRPSRRRSAPPLPAPRRLPPARAVPAPAAPRPPRAAGEPRPAVVPRARGRARRQAFLLAAADLFLEVGFEAASINEVVRRAGGSLTTLYQQFGSKEGLFQAIMTELCGQLLEPLQQMDVTTPRPPREALEEFGRRFLRLILEPRAVALERVVRAEGPRFPELADIFFRSGPRAVRTRLAEYLADLSRCGQANPGLDFTLAAEQFISLLSGDLHFRTMVGLGRPPSSREVARQVRQATDIFLHGVQGA